MAIPHLGEPITARYQIPGGNAQLFTGGVSIDYQGGRLQAGLAFPPLGRPVVASIEPQSLLFERNAVHFDPNGGDVEQRPTSAPRGRCSTASRLPGLRPGRSTAFENPTHVQLADASGDGRSNDSYTNPAARNVPSRRGR